MKGPNLLKAEVIEGTGKINLPAKKKVYSPPQLNTYGNLVDLVKNNPGGGGDGSTFVDCSFS